MQFLFGQFLTMKQQHTFLKLHITWNFIVIFLSRSNRRFPVSSCYRKIPVRDAFRVSHLPKQAKRVKWPVRAGTSERSVQSFFVTAYDSPEASWQLGEQWRNHKMAQKCGISLISECTVTLDLWYDYEVHRITEGIYITKHYEMQNLSLHLFSIMSQTSPWDSPWRSVFLLPPNSQATRGLRCTDLEGTSIQSRTSLRE